MSDDLTRRDREQLNENFWKLLQKLSDVMDVADAIHFIEQWGEEKAASVIEARTHIADCPACGSAYRTLVRDTSIEMIPIVGDPDPNYSGRAGRSGFSDHVTVLPDNPGLEPVRQLSLPQVPASFRSKLRGKELVLTAFVDTRGRARVVRSQGWGISDFVVQRATDVVEDTRWKPAVDSGGRRVGANVRIIFRW